MMLLALLLMADAPVKLAAAQSVNPELKRVSIIPAHGRSSQVQVGIVVDERGLVVRCTAETLSGGDIRGEACRQLSTGVFRVALDKSGRPAFGIVKSKYSYNGDDGGIPPYSASPEASFFSPPIPDFLTLPRNVLLLIEVDPVGKVQACAQSGSDQPPRLGEIACVQAMASWTAPIVTDRAGKPVTYITRLSSVVIPKAP